MKTTNINYRNIARQWFINNHPLVKQWERDGVMWCMHHWDKSLQHKNPNRYNMWMIEDLIPMTHSWHSAMHQQSENSFKGKHHTKEMRKKFSQLRSGENNPNYGKKASEQTKEKIRQKALGRTPWNKGKKIPEITGKNNPGAKQVIQYTVDNKYIAEFDTIAQASNYTGICASCISMCCAGHLKTSGGYIWRYKEENS